LFYELLLKISFYKNSIQTVPNLISKYVFAILIIERCMHPGRKGHH
jgi:hypothetical protein